MSPGRLHPAERRAQADLERALALSRSQALPPQPTDSQPPPPTKYGTLGGGTLDNSSTVQTSQRAGSHSTGVVRSSSDEQVHLPQRLPPLPTYQGLEREVVPPTYVTATASSAPAAKIVVQETPSTHSSARDSTGMNPLMVGPAGLKPFGEANDIGAMEEEPSGELVIADSDGEEAASARLSLSSQSVAPVAGPSRFNALNNPFPIAPPANTHLASSIHDTTTSSLSRPNTAATNTTTTDPIVTSTSAASGPSRSRSSKTHDFVVEIESPARLRTSSKKSSSSGENKKSAAKEKGKGRKRAVADSEEEEEDDSRKGGETDYEQPPTTKAKGPKRQRTASTKPLEERVLSKETVDSEDDDDDEVVLASAAASPKNSRSIVDEEEDDPLTIPGSVSHKPGSRSTGSRPTASTSAGADEADARPAKKSRKSTARSEAVSEDEDGQKRLAEEIALVNDRVEEADSDFETGKMGKKGKKKKAAPKKRQTKEKEGEKEKAKPRRAPTVKKASFGAEDTQVVPETPAEAAAASGAEASATGGVADVGQDDAVMVDAGQAAKNANMDDEPEERVGAKKKGGKGKKKAVVQDSEEEADQPADAVALKDTPASPPAADAGPAPKAKKKGKGKGKAKAAPAPTKRGRGKKTVVPATDDEQDDAASDATSAINTGDESPSDEDDEQPVGRKKGKAPAKKRAAAKKVGDSPASSRAASTAARSVSPGVSRASGNYRTLEDRMEAVTKAAQEADESFIAADKGKSGAGKGKGKGKMVVKDDEEADDEDGEEEMKQADPPSPASSEAKENKALAEASTSRGTPQQVQRGRSSIGTPGTPGTPFSKPPKPGSLAAIMAKRGLATFRPPGLSNRAKLPPLHTNLKPAPPPKKILKEEKPKKKKKKGDESYSDEEKPWWETKDPEEWDSDDHRRWQKRQRRIERGLPADSDDD